MLTLSVTILNSTSSTSSSISVCDSFVGPSGKIFRNSGTYTDTIQNSVGCDSVITLNLTIRKSTSKVINPYVCSSYISPSGKVYTSSATFKDTITNAANCDSVVFVNLTVSYQSYASISLTTCDKYVTPSGKTKTTSVALPPKKKINSAFSACGLEPSTGASTNATLCSFASK